MRQLFIFMALAFALLASGAESFAQSAVPGPGSDLGSDSGSDSQEKVCAYVRSGDGWAGLNEDDACPLFSVVKFPQALYVAHRLSESGKSLDDRMPVRKRRLMQDTWSPMLGTFKSRHRFSYAELLRLSMVESDNNACDLLFEAFGQPAEVERYIAGLGFPGIRIRSTERQMMADRSTASLNAASPKEMAGLLEWFYQHHNDNEYLSYIWQLMSECNTGLSRLPAAVAESDVVVHKTGTGFATATGVAAINDAGIIIHPDGTHSIAVVFVLNHRGRPDSAEALLSKTARGLIKEAETGGVNTVCIYGGTSASVTAAYAAAQKGSRVTVICPDVTIGGMTTGGLGATDIGNKKAVIGLARKFYRQLGEHYGVPEQWTFEPHVAEEILMGYLDSPRINLMQGYYLDSVEKSGTRIISITCKDKEGRSVTIKADQFIDCTYEGDLMARAGVSYCVGREDNSVYGETHDGSQISFYHQFVDGIDPFVVKGDPKSGLLWGIQDWKLKEAGTGDDYVQAYNYRLCLSNDPDNQIPFSAPDNYDPSVYELLVRVFESDPKPYLNNYFIWSLMPNGKTDVNNRGAFSTDMIGMNHNYPEASYEERERIIKAHKDYTQGLMYFYVTDPRVPAVLQDEIRKWGYAKDEYARTGGFTHQLYIREARRLVGEYVATQADCEGRTVIADGIGYAAYQMDSHNCERIVIEKDGKLMVKNEGDVEIGGGKPYPISYRSVTPKREECTNLLVPVCLSASHIAYGSIRMEPVFLEMGQSCGLAAAFARKGAVQDVDVIRIQEVLVNDPYMDGNGPDSPVDARIKASDRPSCINPALRK